MPELAFPVHKVGRDDWVLLGSFGKKFLFRAESILKSKKRVPEPSGHHYDQAVAEGSVKFRPKVWDLSNLS